MPLVEFDVHGNLTPYEVIMMNVDDVEQEFVKAFPGSERRDLLFKTFLTQLNRFRSEIETEFWVWVGGSFITRKVNPSDLDFVIFLDVDCYNRHEEKTAFFRQQRYLPAKLLDGYFVQVYPVEHRRYNWYESDRLRWLQDFGTNLAGRKKGIIQLNF
jgi:hypothetical protein